MITFPISLPSSPTSAQIVIRKRTAAAVVPSQFTYQPQVQLWGGQIWQAEVTLPPMLRANAEPWIAALLSLNGQEGNFLLGDTANRTPRGLGLLAALSVTNNEFETLGAGVDLLNYSDVFADWNGNAFDIFNDYIEASTDYPLAGYTCKIHSNGEGGPLPEITKPGILTAGHRYRVTISALSTTSGSYLRVNGEQVGPLTGTVAEFTVEFTAAGTDLVIVWGEVGPGLDPSDCWIFSVTGLFDLDGPPLVKGGSQTGNALVTDGWLASQTGIMKAGDWFQLGTGSSSRLYKVLADANSDGSGEATLDIWPSLRSSPADNAVVTISSPKGRFMLVPGTDLEYLIDEAKVYRPITFMALEDLRP